jgi:hypothetical protein
MAFFPSSALLAILKLKLPFEEFTTGSGLLKLRPNNIFAQSHPKTP